ncbi:MAG: type II toxin-antitoxin system VapC family toxin [Burkholderiaceae bacterium]
MAKAAASTGAKSNEKAGAVVLDASALLALFNDEPGADAVMQALTLPCLLSAANHTEVLTKLLDKGLSQEDAATVMTSVELRIVAFDAAQSADAAWLRTATRKVGLSLGDRACLALARAEGAAVLTADKPWLDIALAVGLKVQCIR